MSETLQALRLNLPPTLLLLLRRWEAPLMLLLALLLGVVIALGVVLMPNPVLVIGGALALLVVGWMVLDIEVGLLVLVFLTYSRFSDVMIDQFGAPSIAKFFVVFLLGLIAFYWLFLGRKFEGWETTALLVVAYGCIAVLGLVVADDTSATISRIVDYAKDVMITIAAVMIIQRGSHLKHALWVLVGVAVFIGTINTYKYLTADWLNTFWGFGRASVENIVGRTDDYRISGMLNGANPFAQIMLPLVAICLERALHERNLIMRLAAIWGTVVATLTVIFTFSRGSFLGMMLIFALFLILYVRRPTLIALIVVGFLLIQPLMPAQYTDRMSTLLDFVPGLGNQNTLNEVSFKGRTSENMVGVYMFMDHPVLGVGWSNYNGNYLDYSSRIGLDGRRVDRSAHNLYLEIAAELGIVGLTMFLVMIYIMFRTMIRARQQLLDLGQQDYAHLITGLAIGMAGFMLVATFVHDSYPRFFWLLFGLAMSTAIVAQNERKRLLAAPAVAAPASEGNPRSAGI